MAKESCKYGDHALLKLDPTAFALRTFVIGIAVDPEDGYFMLANCRQCDTTITMLARRLLPAARDDAEAAALLGEALIRIAAVGEHLRGSPCWGTDVDMAMAPLNTLLGNLIRRNGGGK